jgi:exopolysaccharide production protein ExoZ
VTPKQNINSLQILRAIAALLVVFWHSRLAIMHAANAYWIEGDAAYRAAHYPALLNHLDIGVDIFFCISGYIMNLLIHKLPATGESSLVFLANRAIRIFPPYWFFTILIVLAFAVSRGKYNLGFLSGNPSSDSVRFLASILLLPQGQPPLLGVGWTLIHEFQFYLLCGLSVFLGINRRLPELLLAISVLAVALSLSDISVLHGYALSTFNIEFLFGALAFKLGKTVTRIFPVLQIAAALLCFFLLSRLLDSGISAEMTSIVRPVGSGLVGLLIIAGLIGADDKYAFSKSVIGVALMRIGDASYTLYLSHWFVLSIMGKLFALVPASSIAVVAAWHLLSVIAAIALAVFLAERVELPCHRQLSLWFKRAMILHARQHAEA